MLFFFPTENPPNEKEFQEKLKKTQLLTVDAIIKLNKKCT